MQRPAPLPDPLHRNPFSVADARARGVSRGRLRGSDLAGPFHGVRVHLHDLSAATDSDSSARRDLASTTVLARAFAELMLPDQVFSHTTAAVLLGLRLPEGFREQGLHVTSIAPTRASKCAGVVGHQSAALIRPIVLSGGIRVTDPVTTWVKLGGYLTVDELVIMADGFLRRKNPLATLDQLRAAVDAAAGKRGARRLRAAVELVRPGTDSARETMLRLVVVRAGFPEPIVNLPIVNRYGAVIAHGDLAFPEYRVLLEYDGGHHRSDERQFHIDIDRLDEIMEENWRVIRVNKSLMLRPATLLGKLRAALEASGWRG